MDIEFSSYHKYCEVFMNKTTLTCEYTCMKIFILSFHFYLKCKSNKLLRIMQLAQNKYF